jgi:hypothetical protein
MDIRVIEAPQTPLRRMTPQELAEGRNVVVVHLERPITLQIENCIVTYPIGQSAAPCVIANALVAAGAELVGSQIPRAAEKPTRSKFPEPTRGGVAGCVRFRI